MGIGKTGSDCPGTRAPGLYLPAGRNCRRYRTRDMGNEGPVKPSDHRMHLHAKAPAINTRFHMVPVDYVADTIAHISRQEGAGLTFNILNPGSSLKNGQSHSQQRIQDRYCSVRTLETGTVANRHQGKPPADPGLTVQQRHRQKDTRQVKEIPGRQVTITAW